MEGAYLLAATLYETDRFREALKEVERARELDGETPELRSRISGVEHRIRTQVVEQELRELGERVKVEPDNFELRFQYYDRLVASGSADRVVVDLEDILTRTPDMRDRVVQEIGGFLERHGRNFRLLSYLSDIHLREQDWDRVFELHEEMARESLHGTRTVHDGATKILQNKPDHCPSLLALARHAGEAGHDSNAADFLDRYYAAGGEKTRDVLALEFDVCCRGTDRQRAAQVGANLVELCPGDTDLLMKLGWLAAADGRFPDAIGYLNRVLVLEPENSQARVLTRDYEQKQKRARIDELRSCLKNIPEEDARIQMELGDLHHDFGQMNEAIVAYQKAALGNRTRNIAQAKLGYVLASKGMHSDAEETLSEVELRVDQPPEEQTKLKALLYRSAELMEEEKEMSRALHVYKRIFRVDAGYRDVVSKIERLQRLEKKK
jgi:tetratricopeptide (TPR) repeat protein